MSDAAVRGLGPRTAASLITRYGHIRQFPAGTLSEENLKLALLFKDLATLRKDLPLFKRVDELRWQGPTASFESVAEKIGDARLAKRVSKLQSRDNPQISQITLTKKAR